MPIEERQLGRFRLIRLLGSGGMGEVYLAEDTRINRPVAIKLIRTEQGLYPDPETTKEASHLFQREMRAISRLDHPNILPLFEYGEDTMNDMLVEYMVMPFRKEGSLVKWLRQRGTTTRLSLSEITYFINQAAAALQHAHDHQIVHQDVKPANFLIQSKGDDSLPNLLLADFGVAKFTSASASMSQNSRGTPTYMPPEQWNGKPTPATDQYALAVMAYEMLTGRPPFIGGTGEIMFQHLTAPPPVPSTFNPAIPPALDAVLSRALAKQPEERFPSIAAFARAFQDAVRSTRTSASDALSASAPPSSSHDLPPTEKVEDPGVVLPRPPVAETANSAPGSMNGKLSTPRKPPSRAVVLVSIICALLVLGSIGYYVLAAKNNGSGSPPNNNNNGGSSTPSVTPATLVVNPTSLNANTDCNSTSGSNYTCIVTLSIGDNPDNQSLDWTVSATTSSGSDLAGITFAPPSGTLNPGDMPEVTITFILCGNGGNLDFNGPTNTVSIPVTC